MSNPDYTTGNPSTLLPDNDNQGEMHMAPVDAMVNISEINAMLDTGIDWEGLSNTRQWLRSAIEQAGATVHGSGIGAGGTDMDIKIDGMPFNVTIKRS